MTTEMKPEKTKRGSGSNKTRRKQREYKDHIRAQMAAGLYNDYRGSWLPISGSEKWAQRAAAQSARMGKR